MIRSTTKQRQQAQKKSAIEKTMAFGFEPKYTPKELEASRNKKLPDTRNN